MNNYDCSQVIDFECTCEADLYDYNHEIIEFPAVLVDVRKKEIVSSTDHCVYLLILKDFIFVHICYTFLTIILRFPLSNISPNIIKDNNNNISI